MYLIHVRLRPPVGAELPHDAADQVRGCAVAHERIEHVSDHRHAAGGPVLGIYLIADDLFQAEARAGSICRRALARCPDFRGWELAGVQAPFVAPFVERQSPETSP
ncbi:hypothetical protein [Streptomyces macrosporus]|uniref:YCII-related domain-containing protein n=1 Tax=Streptomyces macrosporus TaxID=44032 RepID=A0ABN3K6B9_9ACTN